MAEIDEAALQNLVDRDEIGQIIATHARGIDRHDADLLKSVYHADGTVDYGVFEGPAHEFCDILGEDQGDRPVSLHRPTNIWATFDGDKARSESYVTAYMDTPGEDGNIQSLIGGRYLDSYERRCGTWKLTNRTYVLDWNTNWAGTGTADKAFVPIFKSYGAQGAADPGTRLLASWQKDMTASSGEGGENVEVSADLLAKAENALARQEIHDLIMTQARGTDRGDEALLRSAWHPGATIDAGIFEGPADEFCAMIVGATAGMKRMAHSVANEWIKVDGDEAVGESYVIAFTTSAGDDGDVDEFNGGRYLDRFARKGGEWKFTHRTFVPDWSTRHASSDASDEGMMAQLKTRGARFPDDPVYAFWKS